MGLTYGLLFWGPRKGHLPGCLTRCWCDHMCGVWSVCVIPRALRGVYVPSRVWTPAHRVWLLGVSLELSALVCFGGSRCTYSDPTEGSWRPQGH